MTWTARRRPPDGRRLGDRVAILALVGPWLLGGVVMRVGGFLLFLTGAGSSAIGAVVPLLAGAGPWACGRLHRAAHRRA
ncbi:MAG: hypothetical protein JST08_04755 [Actinobacteria bacterium]|nr:hypothetical protein [Actinomycetota bacterium]